MSFDRECLLCFMYTTDLVDFSDIYYLFIFLFFFGKLPGPSNPLNKSENHVCIIRPYAMHTSWGYLTLTNREKHIV